MCHEFSNVVNNRFQRVWFLFRQQGEYLPIKGNVLLLQQIHETAVRNTIRSDGSIDLDKPFAPRNALFIAAIAVGVDASLEDCRFSLPDKTLSAKPVAFRLLQQPCAFSCSCCSSFDSHNPDCSKSSNAYNTASFFSAHCGPVLPNCGRGACSSSPCLIPAN